ncbi:MAG: hypothetical protein JXA72_11930 [Bacteroidales bacterium]|nr:hypothetical protein [Bacteroidales bacterium]
MKNMLVFVLIMSALHTYGQNPVPEIKNAILLIPDGASHQAHDDQVGQPA